MSILDNSWEFLLLPYCAKLLACEYRKKDGCINCGKCSMGFAYEMAEKAGLVPLTIQNFEHLIATLKGFREDGVKGYIGCCCEGFYIKHQDDFEAIQVPGILIDIDDKTCYDLGKEKEAYNGSFENQTILKIDLLSKILDICLKKNIHGDEKRG
jgi:lipoate-protein ligase A